MPKSEIASRVAEALDMVKMTKLAERRPRQMSGGQQQRVAVARALVNRPSVLLLDEPLGALDRKLREEMQIELKLLQSQLGITFVFVTHDQEEAMGMSDRIAIMLDGHIEQLADPETVYERPASAFVAGFIGRNNFWRGVSTGDGVTGRRRHGVRVVTVPRSASQVGNGRSPRCGRRASHCSPHRSRRRHNVLAGEVAGVSHFGDTLQYVVRAPARDVIVLLPRQKAPRLAPGDAVWSHWSAPTSISSRPPRPTSCSPSRAAEVSPLVSEDPSKERHVPSPNQSRSSHRKLPAGAVAALALPDGWCGGGPRVPRRVRR